MLRFSVAFILVILLLTACAPVSPTPNQPAPVETEAAAPAPTSTPAAVEQSATPSPEPTTAPEPTATTPAPAPAFLAFLNADGNLILMDRLTGEQRQITQDAKRLQNTNEPMLNYCCLKWSSDGRLLAYLQEVGTPFENGFQFQYRLMVYDPGSNEARPVLEGQQLTGFAWQPNSTVIAYGSIIGTEYFINPSSASVKGIWAVDTSTGETYELVPPTSGKPLVNPQWSPDGRFLGFEEVQYMEGRGNFAFYDFENQEYVAREEIVGSYSWGPDGEVIAFDRMAYTPIGDERIYLSDRMGGNEQPFSPPLEQSYAFGPVFSPQGDQVAYLSGRANQEDNMHALLVQARSGGEPRTLGLFESVQNLAWSPDGQRLVFSSGPYDARQIIEVTVADGTTTVVSPGTEPTYQPAMQ